jgi:pimeloyl-ACP methyl ester carboxylesterase
VLSKLLTVARSVATPDGRTLAVYEGGDPGGVAVIWHHGTPGCGAIYEPWSVDAQGLGIRLIGYDRAGYGGSTRQPGRRVAACAADVTTIADALELERFAVWGISGGGPHALACAALCDERLKAVGSLASVAPWEAEGLAWLEGMGESNHEEFGITLAGEEPLHEYLVREAAAMDGLQADELVTAFTSLVGPADQAVLTGRLATYLLETINVGLAPGVEGWVDDDLAFAEPWGFDLAAINRPVLIVHGADDRFVPISHGEWLLARVPGAEARLSGIESGHLTLFEHAVRELHEWLFARL